MDVFKLSWKVYNCQLFNTAVPNVPADEEDPFAGLNQDSNELSELVSQI